MKSIPKSLKWSERIKAPSLSTLPYIILLGATAIALWWVYQKLVVKSPTIMLEKYVENKGNNHVNTTCENTKKPYSMLFFFMETCPHCVDFKPTWAKFVQQFKTGPYATKVCLADISADHDDLLSLHKVDTFPTVLLLNNKNKTPTKFTGERSVEGLNSFVSQHIEI